MNVFQCRNFLLIIIGLTLKLTISAQISSNEMDKIILISIENGFSDAQILEELRLKGLTDSEVQMAKVKISGFRENRIKEPIVLSNKPPDSLTKNRLESIKEINKVVYSVFGREIFSNNQFKFNTELQIPSPSNYILGAGDGLILDLSGVQDRQEYLTVSPEGLVRLKYAGPVFVSGLTILEAREKIKNLMSKYYPQLRNGSTSISLILKEIRSINVTITGEVVKPGFYSISSLSTTLNALYVSGGPNDKGSFRNIEVIRGNKLFKKIDLYPLLTTGIFPDDIRLESGDIIRVPFSEMPITLKGAVRRPLKYEMNNNETLLDLLKYGGGLSEEAYKGGIRLERFSLKEKMVMDIPDSIFHHFKPIAGDIFMVDTILNRFTNSITITGPVYRPGIYSWKDSLSISGLIKLASGFLPDAYLDRVVLFRTDSEGRKYALNINLKAILNKDSTDILLQPKDELIVKSIFDLEESLKVTIEGAVQNQGEFPWKKDLKVKDLIFLAGGLKNEAFMEKIIIYRLNKNQSFNIISFDLNDNKMGEYMLEANDKVIIKSEKDLSVPQFVTIYGEIKEPGVFPYADNLTLQDIILLGKGYTEGATQMNIEITRRKEGIDPFNKMAELSESIIVEIPSTSLNKMENEILLKPFDVITIRKNPLLQAQTFVEIKGQLLFPGKYAIQKKDERISSLFFRAGGSLPEANLKGAKLIRKFKGDFLLDNNEVEKTSENFGLDTLSQLNLEKREFIEIAIDLSAALKNPGSKNDVFLEPEDILIIPRQSNLIIVEGEVFNPVGLTFESGRRANYFIKQAGGFKEEAMRKKTFVIFPDGSARSTSKVLGLINKFPRVEPGAFVVVPKMPPSDGRRKFNITDLTLASSTIAGISTFILGIVQLLK